MSARNCQKRCISGIDNSIADLRGRSRTSFFAGVWLGDGIEGTPMPRNSLSFIRAHSGNVGLAVIFTVSVLAIGYALLGLLPAFLFAFGYLGGLILWLTIPTKARLDSIRWPYFLTLGLFVLHKWEEREYGFFPALSKLTGVSVPEVGSFWTVVLYAFAAAWLFIPWLLKLSHPFGYFLAWTFFAAMGLTELAHFIFPFFSAEGYGYFPGMGSVVALAPAAWWGLWRLKYDNGSKHGGGGGE